MKKILVIIFLMSSCNALKTITGGETNLDNDFFQRGSEESLFQGLVAFYRLEEANDYTIDLNDQFNLIDSTGGIDGQTGRFEQGINCFTGSSGSGFIENSSFSFDPNNSQFTVSFWVSMNGLASTQGRALSFNPDNNYYISVGNIAGDTNNMGVNLFTLGMSHSAIDVINTANSFYHFAYTFEDDGSNYTSDLFINGSFVSTDSNTSNAAFNYSDINLCSDQIGRAHV